MYPELWVDKVEWDLDGDGLGMYVYRRMGRYDIAATVTWRGVYRVTEISGGGETVSYRGSRNAYDPVSLTTGETYEVISIRSDLTHRPEG